MFLINGDFYSREFILRIELINDILGIKGEKYIPFYF